MHRYGPRGATTLTPDPGSSATTVSRLMSS